MTMLTHFVSSAAAFAQSGLEEICDTARSALQGERGRICAVNEAETDYTSKEVHNLFDAIEAFIQKMPVVARMHHQLICDEGAAYRSHNPGCSLHLVPHGRCLIVVPANAAIPLAFLVPFAFVAAGNLVEVVANRNVQQTTQLLVDLLQRLFPGRGSFIAGSAREAINKRLADPAIDLLYFAGGSSPLSDLSRRCAERGVKLIYEGEGRSAALFLSGMSDHDFTAAVGKLLTSKREFGGRMCSSPNLVAIPTLELQRFQNVIMDLQRARGENAYFVEDEAEALANQFAPCFVTVSDIDKSMQREWFSTVSYVLSYSLLDDLLSRLACAPYRLQLALFGNDPLQLNHCISSTSYPRYCINMVPSHQDSILPWGNAGQSGQSDLHDFYRKGLRRITLESWPDTD